MLVSREEAIDLLICPKTGQKLKKVSQAKLCTSGENKIEYQIINNLPILIDFDESILSEENYVSNKVSSPITRKKNSDVRRIIKGIVAPESKITSINIERISKSLKGNKEANILIIGGGSIGKGLQPLYDDKDIKIVSFDIYASDYVQFIADAHSVPLPESYFDCVIIQAVLEHVISPLCVVSEIERVLKPGGMVYSETPFMQQVHEGAYDFTRFTESGHRYLFKEFEEINSGVLAGPGVQLLWSIDYFMRGLFRSRSLGRAMKILFFWLQYFDSIIPEKYAVDSASAVFFLGKKVDATLSSRDIISYYKGVQI